MHSEQRPGCFAAILNPITLNRAARAGVGGLDAGASLFVFAVALLSCLAFGAIWWRYDLLSTWNFTQGIREDVAPQAAAIAGRAADLVREPAVLPLIGGLIGVAITLLPSLVELLAPAVLHPGVQLGLNISILFDFVTDWPVGWALVERAGVPGGLIGHIVAAVLVTLITSLVVQTFFIMAITALAVSTLNIIGIGRRGHQGAITIMDGRQ